MHKVILDANKLLNLVKKLEDGDDSALIEIKELVNKSIVEDDPLPIIKAISKGIDEDHYSPLYEMMQNIDDETGGHPSEEDWQVIREHIEKHCKKKPVPINVKLRAAESLAEYLYAKRKSIEVADVTEKSDFSLELSIFEIELLKEHFNSEF